MRRAPHRVWFVACSGTELLDVTGPGAVLAPANYVIGPRVYVPALVEPLGGEVRSRHGLVLSGARSLGQAARRGLPDTLIVAGATLPVGEPPASRRRLVAWLRAHHARIPRLVSICAGAFVLGEA